MYSQLYTDYVKALAPSPSETTRRWQRSPRAQAPPGALRRQTALRLAALAQRADGESARRVLAR
jgi:hypothetical protein